MLYLEEKIDRVLNIQTVMLEKMNRMEENQNNMQAKINDIMKKSN